MYHIRKHLTQTRGQALQVELLKGMFLAKFGPKMRNDHIFGQYTNVLVYLTF